MVVVAVVFFFVAVGFFFPSCFLPLFDLIHVQVKSGIKRLQTFSGHSFFKLSSYFISSQKSGTRWISDLFTFNYSQNELVPITNEEMTLINPVGSFLFFTQIPTQIHSQSEMALLLRRHEVMSIPLAHTSPTALTTLLEIQVFIQRCHFYAPSISSYHRCTKKICSNFLYHLDLQDEQKGKGKRMVCICITAAPQVMRVLCDAQIMTNKLVGLNSIKKIYKNKGVLEKMNECGCA